MNRQQPLGEIETRDEEEESIERSGAEDRGSVGGDQGRRLASPYAQSTKELRRGEQKERPKKHHSLLFQPTAVTDCWWGAEERS